MILLEEKKAIGFEVDGFFESGIKKTKWVDFRNALARLDWAFFGQTQDLSTGNLYVCGQFYHEKSSFILTKETIIELEHELSALFSGKIQDIPLKPN